LGFFVFETQERPELSQTQIYLTTITASLFKAQLSMLCFHLVGSDTNA